MSGVGLLALGLGVLVVGVEDDPGGLATRVYVGSRSAGRYVLVSDPEARARIETAWRSTSQHLVADKEELLCLGPLLREVRSPEALH